VSVRGDLRVAETLRGSLRKKRRYYTVMGRVVLKQRDQGSRRFVKREQWRLIDDDGQELWLEIRRDTNKVVLHEPVPVQPAIDPLSLEVGWTRKLRVRGQPCTVEVTNVRRAEIDHETGAIDHSQGALTATTCAGLRVVDAQGSISTMVVDAHRLHTREIYSETRLSSSKQYKVFGRTVTRPWWIPGFVRRFRRWFPAAISGARRSDWAPVFWIVLMFVVLVLAELAQQFLPTGAFNVVLGKADAGERIVSHPRAELVSITGSVRAGKAVAAAAAAHLTRAHLELGGKAPVVVFDDADLDKAVKWAVFGRHWNGGQVCCSSKRIIVHESIHDEFVRRYTEGVAQLKAGDPMEASTTLAPLSSQQAAARAPRCPFLSPSEPVPRSAKLLSRILADPDGLTFTTRFVDDVVRPRLTHLGALIP